MSNYSLLPNGHTSGKQKWAATGGASPAVIADLSDATYVSHASYAAPTQTLDLATQTIPANEAIILVRGFVRAKAEGKTGCTLTASLRTAVGATARTIMPLTAAWQTINLSGVPFQPPYPTRWTQVALDALQLEFFGTGPNPLADPLNPPTFFLSIAGLWVTTASIPTVTVNAVPATDTSRPLVSWAYLDRTAKTVTTKALTSNVATLTTSTNHGFAVGQTVQVDIGDAVFDGTKTITAVTATTFSYSKTNSNVVATGASGSAWIGDDKPQRTYRVRVFTAAQYGAGGFNPATSTATWDSGVVTSSAAEQQITTDLTAGTTYRAYVVVTSLGGAIELTSTWAYAQFTVDYTDPAPPRVAAAWNPATQAVDVTVVGSGNLLSANQGTAEVAVGAWTGSNCAVDRSNAVGATTGSYATRLVASGAGTMSATTDDRAVTAGRRYHAQTRYYPAVSRTCRLEIEWRNAGGGVISTTSSGDIAATSGAWRGPATVTGDAPVGAVNARVRWVVIGAGAGEAHYLDAVALQVTLPGAADPAWSPGGFGGWRIWLEASSDGGASYPPVRPPAGANVHPTLGFADSDQILVVTDHEAPRGLTMRYRASVYASTPAVLRSAKSTPVTVATPSDGTWWLKAVTTPALNRSAVGVLVGPSFTVTEQVTVVAPLGRPYPVVVAGEILGEDGQGSILTRSAAEHDAVLALLRHQGVLLVQAPFVDGSGRGLQWYVRMTARSWPVEGTPSEPRRPIAVTWTEVAQPPPLGA